MTTSSSTVTDTGIFKCIMKARESLEANISQKELSRQTMERLSSLKNSLPSSLNNDNKSEHIHSLLSKGEARERAEIQQMLETCDELRLRMLASLIYLPDRSKQPSLADASRRKIGALVRTPNGITYALVDNVYVILLPAASEHTDFDRITEDLLALRDHCSGRRVHWLIDFSSVSVQLPALFLGSLYAFKLEIQNERNILAITWLKEQFLPVSLRSSFIKALDLNCSGGNMFSRNTAW